MSYIKEKSADVSTTIELPIDWRYPQCFIAVKYYNADPDAGGAEIAATAGTVTVTARLEVHDKYVSITDGVFNATDAAAYATFTGNANSVKAVPSGITAATHYKLCVVQNETL